MSRYLMNFSHDHQSRNGNGFVAKIIMVLMSSFFFLSTCWAYDLYVSPSGSETGTGDQEDPFLYIQSAIDYAFNDEIPDNQTIPAPSVRILLINNNDGYEENLVLNYFDNSLWIPHLVKEITIQSVSNNPNSCIIKAENTQNPIVSVYGYHGGILKLQGVALDSGAGSSPTNQTSYAIFFETPNINDAFSKLLVDNCHFDNHDISIQATALGQIDSLKVTNSSFHFRVNNVTEDGGIISDGGGFNCKAYIHGNYFENHNQSLSNCRAISLGSKFSSFDICDNEFINAIIGSGTNYNENQNITVDNNKFCGSVLMINTAGTWEIKGNKFSGLSGGFSPIELYGGASDGATCNIERNIFFSNDIPISIKISGPSNRIINTSIVNNSFIECERVLSLQRKSNMQMPSHRITEYRNNLYYGLSNEPFVITDETSQPLILTGENRIPVLFSHFSNVLSETESLSAMQEISYGDPHIFIDSMSLTYSMLWTESIKSPCINNGYPGENNELTDPDGTPPDIGCYYYPHYNREYRFDRSPSRPTYYWMSFPVVDNRTYSEIDIEYWNELGYMFEEQMDTPPNCPLYNIAWSYNLNSAIMVYNGSTWQNSVERVIQEKGYKVRFNAGNPPSMVIVNGFMVDATETPALWTTAITVNGQTRLFDNWIGYYASYTQTARNAFSKLVPRGKGLSYLDHIYTIKTQNWCTSRIDYSYNSEWIIDPMKFTLSEGEMVVLTLLPEAPNEMFWATFTAPHSPIEREQPSAFTYEEKMDYKPVFIDFDPNDLPSEVGILVDGVCLGAAVVDSCLIEVNIYADSAKADGELEIVFFYEGKGKQQTNKWLVYNTESMVFQKTTLRTCDIGDFAYLSFNKGNGDTLTPLLTLLEQNHPNPFNPSTSISFILSQDLGIKLEIYNLRGQRIKTLENASLTKGRHVYEWNGKDDNGRAVSSGIYFTRLCTPKDSFVQKIMLMK